MEHDAGKGRPKLYLVGIPGDVGGASTKVAHLIRLLRGDFDITVVFPEVGLRKDKRIRRFLERHNVPGVELKDLPKKLEGVALAICIARFFVSGMARELKERGLKVVWSNEMMWEFRGEAEAAKDGIIDRVLFVSEFQAKTLEHVYGATPGVWTGNFIDPEDYCWCERRNETFTLGRLSRADAKKYPVDFPVFYEELGLKDVRYRVMAWSQEIAKKYRWHHFGPEWELLPANKEKALPFLYSLDLFVYPLGHEIQESWGRAVVEAMLTGCVPIVPAGHQFHTLMVDGQTGAICQRFQEYKEWVQELYENYPLRRRMSERCAEHAKTNLCNPDEHRRRWVDALTF